MNRVVITGMGIFNSLGRGLDTVWTRLLAGDNGVSRIRCFDPAQYRVQVAAQMREEDGCVLADFDSYRSESPLPSVAPTEIRRSAAVFLACASDAFADSGLAESGFDPDAAGVAVGASVAYTDHELTVEYFRTRNPDGKDLDLARFAAEGRQPGHVFRRRLGDMAAVLAAKKFGLRGPAISMDTACAASGHAIGESFRLVRRGKVNAMICGGATVVVSPIGILYFAVLGALSQNKDPQTASRPFDKKRDGFVMGEGGGAIVLENYEHAKARGAKIYAELAGFGSNTCAVNLTDPSADGAVEASAIQMAMREAGMSVEEVGYIAAHGTSTQKNDAMETKAIRKVFGERAARIPISSNKAQLGHTISGAAVTNVIIAVLAMRDGVAPPTMHLENPDPELDLDYVPRSPRRTSIAGALANSFAFGGHNAVLALRAL